MIRNSDLRVRRWRGLPAPILGLALLGLAHAAGLAQAAGPSGFAPPTSPFRVDRILIKAKSGVAPDALSEFHATHQAQVLATFKVPRGLQVLRVPRGETPHSLIATYRRSGLIEYAEADYRVHAALPSPNDPRFGDGTLWALHNTGQDGGLDGADIDAAQAWDVWNTARNITVAVLDTGVRYTHEDLADNIWTHPVDRSHGLNSLTGSSDPDDDHGHGTRIAGVLGAIGNNGKGVTGVAWQARIMACKFLGRGGDGYISDAIACLDFSRTNGARVINASWGGYEVSLSLSNALYEARREDILVVAAAGNDALDIDAAPYYPACFTLDNIVSVAATTRGDALYSLSNIGATNVDLAAPGLDIYSTDRASDSAYAVDEGTSMSTAYVSGACALLRARFPSESAQQIIHRLLSGTDPLPDLAGLCVSGGRLNLRKALGPPATAPTRLTVNWPQGFGALEVHLSGEPFRTYVIHAAADLVNWRPVNTNTTSDAGTFVFTDDLAVGQPRRFYRAQSTP